MVSVDQRKLDGLKREEWTRKAGQMAAALRDSRGVRYVEAIVFRDWREAGKMVDRPHWQPVGAVVVVEGRNETELQDRIEEIWKRAGAKDLDQRGVTASAVDNW